jgi:hypothetical protein
VAPPVSVSAPLPPKISTASMPVTVSSPPRPSDWVLVAPAVGSIVAVNDSPVLEPLKS